MEFSADLSHLTPTEIGWLAGLLDGEGFFALAKVGRYGYPSVGVNMTDEDIIQHFCALTGTTYAMQRRQPDRKNIFCVNTSGRKALAIMRVIFPYMGQRRKTKIAQIWADYGETRMHVCLECGKEFFHHSVRRQLCPGRCSQNRTNRAVRAHYARGGRIGAVQ